MPANQPHNLHTPSAGVALADEVPNDSELLEQVDINAQLVNYLQDRLYPDPTTPPSRGSGTRAQPGNTLQQTPATPRPLSQSFLIGGFLFEPRPGPLQLHNRFRGLRGSPAFFVVASAVFCPFTHQYFSLASPHWDHLCRAGFALASTNRGAHQLKLYNAERLRRYARQLQAAAAAASAAQKGKHQKNDEDSVAFTWSGQASRAACVRQARLYEARQWSASLQRTRWRDLQVLPVGCGDPVKPPSSSSPGVSVEWADESIQLSGRANEQPAVALPSTCCSVPAWAGECTERRTEPLLGLPSNV
jgi:hypothetical protein